MSDEVLDKASFIDETDGDKDLMKRWVEMFDRDCQNRIPKIDAAIQTNDYDTLMNEAHALKGGLGVLFAKNAYETAYKLETMGRDQNTDNAGPTFATFESELKKLRRTLDEIIND